MSGKIKAGIIGFGLAGRNMHYKALAEGLGDMVEIAAIWTRRPIKRNGASPDDFPVAENVALYNDMDAFLAHPGLDVVHITTPSGLHRDFIVKSAEAGKHVICDKPLEVTIKAMNESIAACHRNNVALSVNFQQRYNPHVQKLKQAITDGLLGDMTFGSVEAKLYRDPEYYTESSWHGKLAHDGGAALMNQGIHYIDLVQWLMDKRPLEVTKGIAERILHTYIEGEDFGYGEFKMEDGAEMTILGGTCFRPGIDQRFEIRGTDGYVTVIDGIVTQAYWGGCNRMDYFGSEEKVEFSGGSPIMGLDNHIRYFRAVYNAILNGDPVPIPGGEARVSTEIILGIYKAWETKASISFPL